QTLHSGTAQQLQQQGFRLISFVMGQHNKISIAAIQSLIPHLASSGFLALAAISRNFDMRYFERNIELLADSSAKIYPAVGVGAEPMMYMHGAKLVLQNGL